MGFNAGGVKSDVLTGGEFACPSVDGVYSRRDLRPHAGEWAFANQENGQVQTRVMNLRGREGRLVPETPGRPPATPGETPARPPATMPAQPIPCDRLQC